MRHQATPERANVIISLRTKVFAMALTWRHLCLGRDISVSNPHNCLYEWVPRRDAVG